MMTYNPRIKWLGFHDSLECLPRTNSISGMQPHHRVSLKKARGQWCIRYLMASGGRHYEEAKIIIVAFLELELRYVKDYYSNRIETFRRGLAPKTASPVLLDFGKVRGLSVLDSRHYSLEVNTWQTESIIVKEMPGRLKVRVMYFLLF